MNSSCELICEDGDEIESNARGGLMWINYDVWVQRWLSVCAQTWDKLAGHTKLDETAESVRLPGGNERRQHKCLSDLAGSGRLCCWEVSCELHCNHSKGAASSVAVHHCRVVCPWAQTAKLRDGNSRPSRAVTKLAVSVSCLYYVTALKSSKEITSLQLPVAAGSN